MIDLNLHGHSEAELIEYSKILIIFVNPKFTFLTQITTFYKKSSAICILLICFFLFDWKYYFLQLICVISIIFFVKNFYFFSFFC